MNWTMVGLLVPLALACAGGPPTHAPGYSKPFTLPGGFSVGVVGEAGVDWGRQEVGGRYEGVVVATWCPACEAFLKDRAKNPAVKAATPAVFYLESELEENLQWKVENGQITPAEHAAVLETASRSGTLVAFPERLEGLDARVVRQSEIPVEWFPFFFSCQDGQCEGWAAAEY